MPYATSYSVRRATTSGGPYTILASGLTGGPYVDATGTSGTTYYYVVTAAGLPVTGGKSNRACATLGATYTPVNLDPGVRRDRHRANGWPFAGPGFDGYGYAYPSALTGSAITWNGAKFALGRAGVPDAAADAGQRVYLPAGSYTGLLLLGAYLGSGSTSTGVFQPTLTYADGSRVTLSQGMTNWCGTASQPGESNAATYSYRDYGDGTQAVGDVLRPRLHDPDQRVAGGGVAGPAEHGHFRLLGMALTGLSRSALAAGHPWRRGSTSPPRTASTSWCSRRTATWCCTTGPDPQHEAPPSGRRATTTATASSTPRCSRRQPGDVRGHAVEPRLRRCGRRHLRERGDEPDADQHAGGADLQRVDHRVAEAVGAASCNRPHTARRAAPRENGE